MSCLTPDYNPVPTRLWSRVQSNFSLVIPVNQFTPDEQMNRKANVLQYKSNSSNLTKKQQYSLIAQGKWTNRTKTWATQSVKYTNPNTHNLLKVENALICTSPAVICVPTSSSDVPGPIIDICYDDSLTTYYPREITIMNTSTNGFPKGIKNLPSANGIESNTVSELEEYQPSFIVNSEKPVIIQPKTETVFTVIQKQIAELGINVDTLKEKTKHQSATEQGTSFEKDIILGEPNKSSVTLNGDITIGNINSDETSDIPSSKVYINAELIDLTGIVSMNEIFYYNQGFS